MERQNTSFTGDRPGAVAVFTAAGKGTRLGQMGPKALVKLAGKPLLVHALENLLQPPCLFQALCVTAPPEEVDTFRQVLRESKVLQGLPFTVTAGGPSRQASVYLGLLALAKEFQQIIQPNTKVLVHDAARALTPRAVAQRVIRAIGKDTPCVVPALPVTDTIKKVGQEVSPGVLEGGETLQRDQLRAVQTPQGFTWQTLLKAHQLAAEKACDESLAATDDAGLVEALGIPSVVVEGHVDALKITTTQDLAVAEIILAKRHQA